MHNGKVHQTHRQAKSPGGATQLLRFPKPQSQGTEPYSCKHTVVVLKLLQPEQHSLSSKPPSGHVPKPLPSHAGCTALGSGSHHDSPAAGNPIAHSGQNGNRRRHAPDSLQHTVAVTEHRTQDKMVSSALAVNGNQVAAAAAGRCSQQRLLHSATAGACICCASVHNCAAVSKQQRMQKPQTSSRTPQDSSRDSLSSNTHKTALKAQIHSSCVP